MGEKYGEGLEGRSKERDEDKRDFARSEACKGKPKTTLVGYLKQPLNLVLPGPVTEVVALCPTCVFLP